MYDYEELIKRRINSIGIQNKILFTQFITHSKWTLGRGYVDEPNPTL